MSEAMTGNGKRSVTGSYHKLSTKHLDAYLDELEWRYNNRKNPYLFRDTLIKLLRAPTLEYKELTHGVPIVSSGPIN